MAVTTLRLVTLMFFHQVFCSPGLKPGDPCDVSQEPGPLKRVVRMTPFWRSIGTKPHRAYCQYNYECSTRICRDGHCSFSHAIPSER